MCLPGKTLKNKELKNFYPMGGKNHPAKHKKSQTQKKKKLLKRSGDERKSSLMNDGKSDGKRSTNQGKSATLWNA